jgi:hypothetical protein
VRLNRLTFQTTPIRAVAVESLSRMSIPDEDRASTWKYQEMFHDYINIHSKQDADKLGGAYGIKPGVQILTGLSL